MRGLTLTTYDSAKDKKNGKPMELSYTSEDAATRLASTLIAKKLCQCTWVRSIRYANHYNHKTVTVTHSNGVIDHYIYDDDDRRA